MEKQIILHCSLEIYTTYKCSKGSDKLCGKEKYLTLTHRLLNFLDYGIVFLQNTSYYLLGKYKYRGIRKPKFMIFKYTFDRGQNNKFYGIIFFFPKQCFTFNHMISKNVEYFTGTSFG